MITIIADLKKQIYEILANKLQYNVMDNPYEQGNKTFPCVVLTLQNGKKDAYKGNYVFTTVFKIDIFSNYNGEKEILDMEQEIFGAMQDLYKNELVTYVRESGFRILDDKSTAVVRKHGVIQYTIYSAGGLENNESNDNETNA